MPDTPVPKARERLRLSLTPPRTLDRRGGLREGTLSAAAGVDPRRLPALCPLPAPAVASLLMRGKPTGMAYLEGRLYVTTFDDVEGGAYLHCYNGTTLTTLVPFDYRYSTDDVREIVQFNLYSDPLGASEPKFRHMGLLFPDGIAFPLGTDAPVPEALAASGSQMPRLSHVCVHLSRLFGTDGDRIYASAYNDPRNFNVDTATDTGAANAWAAAVQSNTAASGDFAALTVFGGQVHAFKEGFCHLLSGTKNPFRISDLFAVGAACPRSIAEVGGKLFFADRSRVYRYNGDTLTPIGDALGERDLSGALGCAHEGMYLLYLPRLRELFAYAPENGAWSSLGRVAGEGEVRFLVGSPKGALLLDDAGKLYTLGVTDTADPPRFTCSFAPITAEGETLLRLSRLSLAVEGEAGARVRAAYTDLSGRERPLLDATLARTGLCRLHSRMFTPADHGGEISLVCEGALSVQKIELTVETQE